MVPVPAVQTGSAKKLAESEWCKNEQCKWIVRRQGQGRTDVVVVVEEEEEEEEEGLYKANAAKWRRMRRRRILKEESVGACAIPSNVCV